MIRKLVITDFESHKSTTFEFGPGLNCIHGESNHGKSSSLRALELPAYGSWAAGENKKTGISGPVRIGASSCEVYVESDRGNVKVTRGKGINEWEINNLETGKSLSLQNPGAGSIPEAQEVIGIQSMNVAGNVIRFNWSDQRDKHFLIDEVEGKSSSPSLVAAILDEVGGISGCEDLIRALASDKSKLEQEMKKTNESVTQAENDLEQFSDLDKKLEAAKNAEKLIAQVGLNLDQAKKIRNLKIQISSILNKIELYKNLDLEILERERAEEVINEAIEKNSISSKILSTQVKFNNVAGRLKIAKDSLSKSEKVDVVKAQEFHNKAKDSLALADSAKRLHAQIKRKLGVIERFPTVFVNFLPADDLLERASICISDLMPLQKLLYSLDLQNKKIKKAEIKFKEADKTLNDKKQEFEELFDSAGKFCLFCKQEISDKCKEEILSGV